MKLIWSWLRAVVLFGFLLSFPVSVSAVNFSNTGSGNTLGTLSVIMIILLTLMLVFYSVKKEEF